jgi:hypothetical protein
MRKREGEKMEKVRKKDKGEKSNESMTIRRN